MRSPRQLLHSRTRVCSRYALMPLEGYPPSRLPEWSDAEARILAAPVLGAEFVQYLIQLSPQGGTRHEPDHTTEWFVYVMSGEVQLQLGGAGARALTAGGYALVPHTQGFELVASRESTLLVLKKAYEPAGGVPLPEPIFGNEAQIPAIDYGGNPGTRLQTLIPDELTYDLAMNIFTFAPGHSLPVVETHVMEHGLYFMQGKGVYYLDDTWMEVEAGDFIWMGPYVPQSFYATGPDAAKYIYYKNVNRDVRL